MHQDWLIAAKFFIVVEGILFILRRWLSAYILSTNVFNYVSHIVVLAACKFSAATHDDFISTFAEIFFIVSQEILTALHPHSNFGFPAIIRCSDLFQINFPVSIFRFYYDLWSIEKE